jgi:hypothetical protein
MWFSMDQKRRKRSQTQPPLLALADRSRAPLQRCTRRRVERRFRKECSGGQYAISRNDFGSRRQTAVLCKLRAECNDAVLAARETQCEIGRENPVFRIGDLTEFNDAVAPLKWPDEIEHRIRSIPSPPVAYDREWTDMVGARLSFVLPDL